MEQPTACARCGYETEKLFLTPFVENGEQEQKEEWLCGPCIESVETQKKKVTFQQSVEAVEKQQTTQEETMRKAETIILAQDVARGQGIFAATERLHNLQPFFVDENRLLWVWDLKKKSWNLSDDLPNRPVELITIMKEAMRLLGDATVRYESLLSKAVMQVGLMKRPRELGYEWVQFGTILYNLKTGEEKPSTPDLFVPNAIPWPLGENDETPNIDKLFESWVGHAYVETLHEIIAYSCLRGYPIHSIFSLTGSGRNGKSSFLRLQKKFLGENNVASTNLDRLQTNRFETFNLYKKLVAVIGETDFAILQTTSLIKQLVGQDLIPFEKKGGATFSAQNYAKLILATNSLPSSNDTSEGFYRRWIIIDFPNEFPEGADILETIPEEEYSALARKASAILPAILKRNHFTNQGSIEERKKRYIAASNPLINFIEEHCCIDDPNACTRFSLLYMRYAQWLGSQKKRVVKKKEFTTVLENEGFEIRKTSVTMENGMENGLFVFGLSFKDEGFEFGLHRPSVTNVRDMTVLPLRFIHEKTDIENPHIEHIGHTDRINAEFDFPTKYDTLDFLQKIQGELFGAPVPFEAISKAFPGKEELVQIRLTQAKSEGEAFEPRSGFWLRM